ncbi:MAG: NAD(P)-binding domain-containing protein [Bacteroidota bacterium]
MKKSNSNISVCVIGAGPSGITAIKNVLQVGVSKVVCYEQNDQVGGNWIFSTDKTHSSVYETTHIITSKTMSQYSDYPMPDHYPDYPSHQQLLDYFQGYARHFNLLPYIQFNTKVMAVEKLEGDQWLVKTDKGDTQIFDYVLVCNGHHSVPKMPKFKGDFTGRLLHSRDYKHNRIFADERVLVVGLGNSGCDCAVEISRTARFVGLSQRSPQYIVPKFFMGRATDTYNNSVTWMPKFIGNFFKKKMIQLVVGTYDKYGLLVPKFPVAKSLPTVNDELLYKIRHGKVHVRRGVERLSGKEVHFSDGKVEEYDTIIAATGYKLATPFIDKSLLDYSEASEVPLYLRIFNLDHKGLIFIGLVNPQGAIWRVSDVQAQLVANYVAGNWQYPNNVRNLMRKDLDHTASNFLHDKKYVISEHLKPYLQKLDKAMPSNAPVWGEIDHNIKKPVSF